MTRRMSLVLALVAALAAIAAAGARADTTVTGTIGDAPYTIKVPTDWNGTLLVFAHGYRDKADHPGEVDNRSADASPNPALDAVLMAQGYALAGSAYSDNGWAIKEGIHDTRLLTARFAGLFEKPDRTLLWGFSLGSIVALSLAEQANGLFDGYVAACAVAAGTTRAWDGALAHLLAYKVAFGMPSAWGTPGDVRNDLDFESEVLPKLVADIADPAYFGKTEFIRLVTQVTGPGAIPPPVWLRPVWLPNGLFTNMFFLSEAHAELERRAGGPVAQNLTHTYTLSAAEKAYLAALGVNADALLAAMNGEDHSAESSARNYARHWADFEGKIKGPVLTLHTQVDTLVPPLHESAYAVTVAEAGRSGSLYQAYTSGLGHCAFTGPQLLTAVSVLDRWVATGTRPTPASFPEAFGFVNDYTPAPWPQP
jgi:pimeloyl-ACP methyl ester carboxylesterase